MRNETETSSFDGGKSAAAGGKREKAPPAAGGEFPGLATHTLIDGLLRMIDEELSWELSSSSS